MVHIDKCELCVELLQNKGFNKTVDTYAFAVILWEIFAAEIPFLRLDVNEIRNRVISGKRPPIPSYGFTPRLVRLINDCWFVHFLLCFCLFVLILLCI